MSLEAIFISIATGIAANYIKDAADKSVGPAKEMLSEAWELFNWGRAADRYQKSLQEQHAKIRILGKSEPIPLKDIFTDLYILDTLTAHRRFSFDQIKANAPTRFDRHPDQRRVHGLKLVSQPEGQRLFILGKPGAGKTTFLRHITLKAIEGKIKKIPIFISLKEWSMSGQTALLPFILQQFEICQFPRVQTFVEYILEGGQAIILFDGLDEVNQEDGHRRQLTYLLQNFAKQYGQSQIFITCRLAANDYAFEGFQDVEVADFTDKQIKAFVAKWFRDDEIKRRAFLEEFYADRNEGVRELGHTPILLTLLCLTFEANMEFPHQRAEIYYDALDILLRRWDKSRSIQRDKIYEQLTPKRKQHMFAHIAAKTFEEGDYFIPQRKLEKLIETYLGNLGSTEDEIDGQQILKAIEAQHGLFVERAKRIYAFSHLTFQEYFTAKYIVDNEARGTTERLIDHHLTDDRWREVFLLTASLLDEGDEFFNLFRQAIDRLITDEALVELLVWVNRKAMAEDGSKATAMRMGYLFIALDGTPTRDLAPAPALDLNRDLNNARARAEIARNPKHYADSRPVFPAPALALVLEFIRCLDLANDLASVHDFKLDLNLVYTLYFGQLFRRINDVDFAHPHVAKFADYFVNIVQLSQQVNAPDLIQALAGLTVPLPNAVPEVWEQFSKQFEEILRNHRDLEYAWNLKRKQLRQLTIYLEANKLFLDCLDVADYVSNRQVLKDSLLLPPGEWRMA